MVQKGANKWAKCVSEKNYLHSSVHIGLPVFSPAFKAQVTTDHLGT